MEKQTLQTDVLIIGGGTAGCYAALTLAAKSQLQTVILEKAHIIRSGCLAAGVNALNAYIVPGKQPEDYVAYAKKDAADIVREDLLLSMAQRLNKVTKHLEELGLVILKDAEGNYVTRGNRNIKINGENIKPILAQAVQKCENVKVYEEINVIDYIVQDGKVIGAYAIGVTEPIFYTIYAKAVICATGGAAGIYKPNNPGFSQHKMWYSPFNTGAGYAMGIRAGAEMTTFEMRFIALRCKDTISPTGTIAQGVGAKQINSLGEVYEQKYGLTTSQRLYGTVSENKAGRGPCYLKTEGIDQAAEESLLKAYLNMSPAQTLKWIESGKGPSETSVEIEGTEPYIVGGHTASGYWVDSRRRTTLKGLYAAGDVAGGCPQKYVTGALVEGEIAAEAIISDLQDYTNTFDLSAAAVQNEPLAHKKYEEVIGYSHNPQGIYTISQVEEAMQKIMDAYAGGIGAYYEYNEAKLQIADTQIDSLIRLSEELYAEDSYDLMTLYELKERLEVAKVVIAHLSARKETRWHSFAENTDYRDQNDDYLKYINSKKVDGKIKIIYRDLVKAGETYEHYDSSR